MIKPQTFHFFCIILVRNNIRSKAKECLKLRVEYIDEAELKKIIKLFQ